MPQDLGQLAPSAKDMIRALILDLPMVNDMLRDQLATGRHRASRFRIFARSQNSFGQNENLGGFR